jgi:hypothetical protein
LFSGQFLMTFSGDAGLLPIYLSIPKRRIGWSSGGGGENPWPRFSFLEHLGVIAALQGPIDRS